MLLYGIYTDISYNVRRTLYDTAYIYYYNISYYIIRIINVHLLIIISYYYNNMKYSDIYHHIDSIHSSMCISAKMINLC